MKENDSAIVAFSFKKRSNFSSEIAPVRDFLPHKTVRFFQIIVTRKDIIFFTIAYFAHNFEYKILSVELLTVNLKIFITRNELRKFYKK